MKNLAAVALAKLRTGVIEKKTEKKKAAVRLNLEKARKARWPAK